MLSGDSTEIVMRVLNCILENRFGGPHRRNLTVAKGLRSHGIETIFLVGYKTREKVTFEDFECHSVEHSQFLRRKRTFTGLVLFTLFLPYNVYKICKIIKRRRIDLIHINGLLNVIPALAGVVRRKPVVWHCNDGGLPHVVVKIVTPLVLLLSSKCIVQGKNIGERLFGDVRRLWAKIEIIYPPVDAIRFSRESVDIRKVELLRGQFNLNSGQVCVGAVGNINPCKGFEYFIKAAAIVRGHVGNAKFLIVGSKLDTQKDYWDKLQNLVSQLRLKNTVLFVGFSNDMPELLSLLDVFVLSSVRESCPNVVLEAMAMRVPVVATDVGSVAELVGADHSGVLVEPNDHEAIANAILRLLKKPKAELGKMVCEARKRSERLFAVERICDEQRNVYEALCRLGLK